MTPVLPPRPVKTTRSVEGAVSHHSALAYPSMRRASATSSASSTATSCTATMTYDVRPLSFAFSCGARTTVTSPVTASIRRKADATPEMSPRVAPEWLPPANHAPTVIPVYEGK